MRTVNTYNVYRDDQIYMENVTNQQAARLSGCSADQISTYANSGAEFHAEDGDYTFKKAGSTAFEKQRPIGKSLIDENKQFALPDRIKIDWENMRTAARILKTGNGKIVEKHGKKYVEVIA